MSKMASEVYKVYKKGDLRLIAMSGKKRMIETETGEGDNYFPTVM